MPTGNTRKYLIRWIVICLGIASLALIWKYTPLGEYVETDSLNRISDYLSSFESPSLMVLGAFLLGSIILFPITALVVIAGLTLPPLYAILIGSIGFVLSSCTGYALGWALGPHKVKKFLGEVFTKVQGVVKKNTVISVFIIRHLPLGPFSLVNVALGSMHVSFTGFILGNLLSALPMLLLWVFVGDALRR